MRASKRTIEIFQCKDLPAVRDLHRRDAGTVPANHGTEYHSADFHIASNRYPARLRIYLSADVLKLTCIDVQMSHLQYAVLLLVVLRQSQYLRQDCCIDLLGLACERRCSASSAGSGSGHHVINNGCRYPPNPEWHSLHCCVSDRSIDSSSSSSSSNMHCTYFAHDD